MRVLCEALNTHLPSSASRGVSQAEPGTPEKETQHEERAGVREKGSEGVVVHLPDFG